MANKDKSPIARAMIWVAVLSMISGIVIALINKPEWFGLDEDETQQTEQPFSSEKDRPGAVRKK